MATRRSARRSGPPVCRCPNAKPLLVATFRNQELVEVERRHWRSKGCSWPAEPVDPKAYVEGRA